MIETKKFKNGLRVLVAPMKSTEAVTILVLVNTGSVYETKNISGISHFLEHLFFKGSKSRPKIGQISRELDGLGAEHNAFTSEEVTGFWIKSSHYYFARALEIIADLLLNPLFKSEEIEKERGVILQEISMYKDMPQQDVWRVFDELIFGDQPAGWNVAGTPQSVKNIKREDVVNYKNRQYGAPNVLVAVAGNISLKDAFSKIEAAFEKLPSNQPQKMKKVTFRQNAPRVKIKHKDCDQTHFILGVPGYTMFDERKYPLDLLSIILGGNASSRLYMEIREKLGLAYYLGSSAANATYGGSLIARAGVPHTGLKKALGKITAILKNIRQKGVSLKEIKLAKDYVHGKIDLSFETSDQVAMFYAEQALFRKEILSPEEIWQKMEKISRDDLAAVARDLLRPSKFNLAIIGPHKNDDFINLLA